MTERRVVGVRFRHAGKVYYFDPGDADVKPGDTVIVETVRGVEAADVVSGPRMVLESSLSQPLRSVLRKATAEDVSRLEENRAKEDEALRVCREKVAEHNLDMQLVGADYTFDRGKLIFYFTSEGRVDFRQLVRDLSATFKTRIELRQIGVRDEAKMLGGLGSCGRQLCCCTFLSEFLPVSIRMASSGHASTQNPQNTHRPMSMSKDLGRFSMFGSSTSSALMKMQKAGQTVSHIMHATQRGVPSGCRARRCRERRRGAAGRRTSGY